MEQLMFPVMSGLDEAQLLHHNHKQGVPLYGFFSISVVRDGKFVQQAYPNSELSRVLAIVDTTCDTYISQQSFTKRNRQAINLASLNSNYIDLDFRTDNNGADWLRRFSCPKAMATEVVSWMDDAGIARPSIIIHSGRGLHLKWLYATAQPKCARPRWDAVQKVLAEKLQPLCADRSAIDVSRVLRLVGTMNTKAALAGFPSPTVTVAWSNAGWDGEKVSANGIKLYEFDELCDQVLPYKRKTPERRAWDKAKEHERTDRIKPVGWKDPTTEQSHQFFEKLAGSELWWSRMMMIEQLVEMRYGSAGVAEGERETFLWMTANALAWSTPDGESWDGSLKEMITRMIPTFSAYEIATYTSNIKRRLGEYLAAKEEKRETGWDEGLYKMSHATFCKKLNMNTAEVTWANQMKSAGMAPVQRRRQMKSARVRSEASSDKKSQATTMSQQGMTAHVIAAALEVSYSTIKRWLK